MAFPTLATRQDHDHYEAAVEKNSFDGQYTSDSVIVTLSIALALYNSLEMLLLVFSTFRSYKGLYFWSLSVCNFGVFAYAIGILMTYFDLGVLWLGKTILDIGWVSMVTTQSLVLYSRLNLVLDSIVILRAVKWTIITVSCTIIPIVLVFDYGTTYTGRASFFEGYYYIEQIQLIVISVQELAISGLYVWKAISFLKGILKTHTRRIIWQLFAINIIIIAMDVSDSHHEADDVLTNCQIAIIALQFLHYQLYQEGLKGFFYSVKLKLELNILSKLVDLVNGDSARRTTSLGVIEDDPIPGRAVSDLEREISPMDHWRKPSYNKGTLEHIPSYSKGTLEHIKEDGQIGQMDQPSSESSPSQALDDDDDDIMRITSQQTFSSSRTRGRESDMWYAEMLRDMK